MNTSQIFRMNDSQIFSLIRSSSSIGADGADEADGGAAEDGPAVGEEPRVTTVDAVGAGGPADEDVPAAALVRFLCLFSAPEIKRFRI